jgi:hypothetical protein
MVVFVEEKTGMSARRLIARRCPLALTLLVPVGVAPASPGSNWLTQPTLAPSQPITGAYRNK